MLFVQRLKILFSVDGIKTIGIFESQPNMQFDLNLLGVSLSFYDPRNTFDIQYDKKSWVSV